MNCEKTGLPILPVRYSVLPNSVKALIPKGISGTRVTDVALDAHHYGLRTLREGWVFLFYEAGPRGNRYWEAYKVTPDGRLWKQSLPLPQVPLTDPACARRAIAVPMDLIAIERPEKCTGRVFIAFSEHLWHKEVFERYAANAALMRARMQCIEPSKWIGSGTDSNGHAIVATNEAIDDVIEYMPGLDPKLLNLPEDKQAFSDEKGNHREDWLKREVTRYPIYIRQTSPISASQALVKLMKQIGAKDQGDACHPPMMLALWDGIGNAHELNGFRSDPVSWLDRYVSQERSLQIGALQSIDSAHAIVQSQADHKLKEQNEAAERAYEASMIGQPNAQKMLIEQRARKLAGASPGRAVQINAYYDDMLWMDAKHTPSIYRNKLISFAQSTSAVDPFSTIPYSSAYRDQIMHDARGYLPDGTAAQERKLTTRKLYWSKYEARLKRQDVESFRKKYKALQSAVFDLQESRTADVGKWLQAKLFLDTLEDYASTDMIDALAFEVVITEALAGIGSTPTGKRVLDALVTQWDPLEPGSLIWRVFAMNKKETRQELGQLLKTALAKKNMPLEPVLSQAGAQQDLGVATVISACDTIGKLNGHYENLAKLALETDPNKISPLGALLRQLKVDRFGLTVGDAIFSKFRINQLGTFVGEKIIQTVLLRRAGVSHSDAMALVRVQAKLEMLSREETIERLLRARSLLRGGAPASAPRATQALYDMWNTMRSTEEGIKAARFGRIAVVAALLEAVNFYKLISAAPDPDTKLKLVQSGASMLSSLITITMTPYYAVLKDSIRSKSWKLVGGGLSSFGTFISAWVDGEVMLTAVKKQQYDLFTVYLAKTTLGAAAGTATLIDATSAAAPLLKKLATRYGTTVVIEAVEVVTTRVVAWAALRIVTMLTGWEVTIGLLFLQGIADWLTPNELESWCSRCAFGTGQEAILHVTEHSVERYTDPSQQEKDFANAMTNLS